jgi:hypothetical protein
MPLPAREKEVGNYQSGKRSVKCQDGVVGDVWIRLSAVLLCRYKEYVAKHGYKNG